MKQWPQFRGPFASGIVESDKLPERWNIHSGENIRWTLRIPGLGHSCPVIWEDKLFVTTAISGSGSDSLKVGLYGDIDEVGDRSVHDFRVYCIDRKSGKILWDQLAHQGDSPHREAHQIFPCQSHTGNQWQVCIGLFWLGGFVLLRFRG